MRRIVVLLVLLELKVSIHASVKDATRPASFKRAMTAVSIHASVKDATDRRSCRQMIEIVSIHASVKDAT